MKRALLFLPLLAACAAEPGFVDHPGVQRFGVRVDTIGGCSTGAVAGLSQQLVDEQNCIRPDSLVSFAGTPKVTVGGSVNALLEPPAITALAAAAQDASEPIAINSAFRTLAQQYLLKKWEGTCGITLAATPGNSNHETGLALDVANHDAVKAALEAHDWKWLGASDVVHFDYVGAGGLDLRADSVLAFQRLWNRNHPSDLLTLDGDYGPATESRLAASPAEGFPIGAMCDDLPDGGTDQKPAPADLMPILVDAGELPFDFAAAPPDLNGVRPVGRMIHGGCAIGGETAATATPVLALLLALLRRRRIST